jgi:hypothetical protein
LLYSFQSLWRWVVKVLFIVFTSNLLDLNIPPPSCYNYLRNNAQKTSKLASNSPQIAIDAVESVCYLKVAVSSITKKEGKQCEAIASQTDEVLDSCPSFLHPLPFFCSKVEILPFSCPRKLPFEMGRKRTT